MKIKAATNFVHHMGQKLKDTLEFGIAVKGAYDIGKNIYSAARLAAPLLAIL